MGDWADSALSRLRDKEGDEYEKNRDRALKRRQVFSDAPFVWSRLHSKLKEEIDDFSQTRPDYLTSLPVAEGVVLDSPESSIRVVFNPDTPRITYKVQFKPQGPTVAAQYPIEGAYSFHVNDRDDDVWLYDQQNVPRSTDDVAETILDHLI